MGASLLSFLTGTALVKLTDALASVLMMYKNIRVLKKKFFKRSCEKRAELPSTQTVPILKQQTIQHTGISHTVQYFVQIMPRSSEAHCI